MKKFFTLLFAGTAMLSATSALAETKTVSNKADFIAAFGANTDTIFITEDIAAGTFNQSSPWPSAGNIHIIGVTKEDGTLPLFTMRGNKQPKHEEYISLHFENLQLMGEGNNYFLYYSDADEHNYDTLEFKNCEILGTSRAFIRFAASSREKDGETITAAGTIKNFRMNGCTYHNGYLTNNPMPILYFGTMVESMEIENNLFYDMGYVNSLVGYNYLTGNTAINLNFTFKNNTVIGTTMKNALLGFASYVGPESQFTIQNNFFLNPNWKDTYNNLNISDADIEANPDTLNTYPGVYIANITYGLIDFDSNVLSGYREAKNTTSTDAETGEKFGEWADISTGTKYYTMEEVEFGWDKFTDAQGGLFSIWNQEKVYTAGKDGEPIGCLHAYTAERQTVVSLEVSIEGSKSATVTIAPQKGKYVSGDEVTLTCNTGGLSDFKGWTVNGTSIGTENPLKLTLAADTKVIATFEEHPYYAIWAFNSNATSDIAPDYTREGFNSTLQMVQWVDSLGGYTTANQTFQWRNNKMPGDVRNCVIARDSLYNVTAGHVAYAQFNIDVPTADMVISCYVGTENYTAKVFKLEYTKDNGATWTSFAETDTLSVANSSQWVKLEGQLPAEALGQAILVRIKGDEVAGFWIGQDVIDLAESKETTPEQELTFYFPYIADIQINGSGTDAIETLEADKNAASIEHYDILGRRISKAQKGLQILNGKVVFVK